MSQVGVGGASLEYLARFFGGTFRETPQVVSVGLVPLQLTGYDFERTSLSIVNLSGSDVWVSPTQDPSSSKGFHLDANGGAISMNVFQDTTLQCLEWWAIAGGAASAVFVLGVRRETAIKPPQG